MPTTFLEPPVNIFYNCVLLLYCIVICKSNRPSTDYVPDRWTVVNFHLVFFLSVPFYALTYGERLLLFRHVSLPFFPLIHSLSVTFIRLHFVIRACVWVTKLIWLFYGIKILCSISRSLLFLSGFILFQFQWHILTLCNR